MKTSKKQDATRARRQAVLLKYAAVREPQKKPQYAENGAKALA